MHYLWNYKGQTYAVDVNVSNATFVWFDSVESSCGDDLWTSSAEAGFARQAFTEFERSGPPPRVGPLPEEVARALQGALDEAHMRRCLRLARRSREAGEAAVGSVVVWGGVAVGEGVERTKQRGDPAAHAEVEAVRAALRDRGPDLSECTLYTTVEPCFMCAYVIREARIGRVVYGTPAGEVGAASSRYRILLDDKFARWGAPPEVVASVLGEDCRRLLYGE